MMDTQEVMRTPGDSPGAPAAAAGTVSGQKRSREDSTASQQARVGRLGRGGDCSGGASNGSASTAEDYVDVDGTAMASSHSDALHAAVDPACGSGDSPPPTRAAPPTFSSSSSAGAGKAAAGAATLCASGGSPLTSSHAPDLRRMKQATLPMYGLMGDSASLKKELLDRDTQIEELRARVKDLEDDLVRRDTTVGFTETQMDRLSERLAHFQAVMRREMRSASHKSRADARRTLYQKHFELGQATVWQANGREVWVEGNVVRELLPLEVETQRRRDEVEALKRAAQAQVKRQERQDREESSAAGPPDAPGGGGEALVEALKEYHLRSAELAALNAQLASYKQRREELEREKKAFVKEVRRINDEDASQFVTVEAIGPDNNRYLLMSLLGKGGFSEVWRAFDLVDGQYVACKIHKVDRAWSQQVMENYRRHAERELLIMRQLDHPNLTRQYNVFQLNETMFVSVIEHCPGMDLDTYLKRYGSLAEKDAQLVVRQVVCALLYLAGLENPVIHYDLKPANILLQSDDATISEIKITDFGLSKIVGTAREGPSDNPSIDLTSQGSGTYWYLPPECFETSATPRISNKVDVWAMGIIFYQMLYGKRPFAEGVSQHRIWQERLIVSAARTLIFPEAPRVSSEARDFISHCLTFNVADRYDIFQASQHPYLTEMGRRSRPTRSKNPSSTN